MAGFVVSQLIFCWCHESRRAPWENEHKGAGAVQDSLAPAAHLSTYRWAQLAVSLCWCASAAGGFIYPFCVILPTLLGGFLVILLLGCSVLGSLVEAAAIFPQMQPAVIVTANGFSSFSVFFFFPPPFNFLTILFKQQVEKSLELKPLSGAGFEHSIKENTLNFLVLPTGIKNQCIPCTVLLHWRWLFPWFLWTF